jgi:hypothetical protein
MHAAATSKVENSAQGSSCKLKFVHGLSLSLDWAKTLCLRQSHYSIAKKQQRKTFLKNFLNFFDEKSNSSLK